MADPSDQEIVDSWFSVAVGGKLPLDLVEYFFRFAALWISFNAIYTNKFPRGGAIKYERDQVKAFGLHFAARHSDLLANSPSYADACGYLAKFGIVNMRDGVRETISGNCPAEGVFSLLYTIRCNFLHGDKNPAAGRDKTVIAAGTAILGAMLSDDAVRSLT